MDDAVITHPQAGRSSLLVWREAINGAHVQEGLSQQGQIGRKRAEKKEVDKDVTGSERLQVAGAR